jgi:hypothetical protein
MQPGSRYAIGVRFGLITGLLYAILLFLRYKFLASTPPSFFYISLATYVIVLMMFLFTGIARKKQLGGYAEIQEIFQSIFIAILITELTYVLFNFIYMKYADPGFLERFKSTSLAYYNRMGQTPEQIHTEMDSIHALSEGMKPVDLIKGFGTIVVIDSIFGFIFAAIIRKKRPISPERK